MKHSSTRKGVGGVAGFNTPKRAFLLLKLVETHSFQVVETTFPLLEQMELEKRMSAEFRNIGVPFPRPYFIRPYVVCGSNLRSWLLIKMI